MNTFLFAAFAMGLAAFNEQYPSWSFMTYFSMLSFAAMQFLEFLLWRNLGSAVWNRRLSMAGLAIIILQPLAAISALPQWRTPLLLAYSVFVLWTLASTPFVFKTSRAPNGHLAWEWLNPLLGNPHAYIWLLFLMSPALLRGDWKLAFAYVLTFGVSMWSWFAEGTAGSMWCWMLNIFWFFVLADILIFTPCGFPLARKTV